MRSGSGSALVRIYGGEGLIDRAVEAPTFAAVSAHLGAPACLALFANGRFEEYLENHRTLALPDFRSRDISRAIAKALAQLHAFLPPQHLADAHGDALSGGVARAPPASLTRARVFIRSDRTFFSWRPTSPAHRTDDHTAPPI